LKVVLKETGIKADTLRAWERRYGMPQPDRTSGGHRLYSQYDIHTIRWLQARIDEGLRINRAVKLWRSIEKSGQNPLKEMPLIETIADAPALETVSGESLVKMRNKFVLACMDFDERRAENILAQALASYSVELVCLEVLRAGLAEIGERWYRGESTVQQEHFASSLIIRRLNTLISAAPAPTKREKIMVACPPQEDHVFSPLIITLFLRRKGWDVVYLGANVPIQQLDKAVESTNPKMVVMVAHQLYTAANLLEAARFLDARDVTLAFGGLVFTLLPELKKKFPGYYLGDELENAAPAIENILASPPDLKPIVEVPDQYLKSRQKFIDSHSQMEAHLWGVIQRNGMHESHLEIANEYLSRDISAALNFGDMGLLSEEIAWIQSLLENYKVPKERLFEYLAHYRKAVETYMEEDGRPILQWLDEIVVN
jgi:methanogenic corrinoid protein MtbC1